MKRAKLAVFVTAAVMAIALVVPSGADAQQMLEREGATDSGLAIGLGVGVVEPPGGDVDLAWRFHVWYNFMTYTFFEAGYVDIDGIDGADLGAGLRYPIPETPVAVFVKGGGFFYAPKTGGSSRGDATTGAGITYDLPWRGFGLRFDYEHFFLDSSSDADAYTTSIYWNIP